MIKKAVFPVAGMGTRFLPATKANPKEMMPVVDKPLIQYAVEEAISAGIQELIFVTSSSKRAIEDHFDSNFELETKLRLDGKNELLDIVRGVVPDGISCIYIRQSEALGLGHAILCAKRVVGNEPFAVLLADDLMSGNNNLACLKQMVLKFKEVSASIVAVEAIAPEDSVKYGVVGVASDYKDFGKITQIVEKPKREAAPSHLGVVGRYILMPEIFTALEQGTPGANGEIQLTDAISALLAYQSVHAFAFSGKRYDCGSKLGYLQAIVAYGLKHPEVAKEFQRYLNTVVSKKS
ncbi:MAG TPA: UTP--glucose-1-phosphate uridylyltransferase GalU [Gammaproteobacteria bacterium]|nr:UTP--glucose-1-phosphate uridylyltransferase GalU [Gammaproteobacteria bacterium]